MDSRILSVSEHDIRYYLMEYVKELGTIDPQPKNHWRFVPEEWVAQASEREREILFGNSTPEEDSL
jgi:2',3'-cyclic-nucleotide 2'-phosphodiesterase/3'-nucleotidase